ncbi:hypothetical protein M0805_003529 [Coniferiporia weirii]|nr:hypothetical protein M0805_003529 [Coniferiporia weirii]
MGQMLGAVRTLYGQTWPPKPKFSVDDIPDLSGKVVIVTGGYAGIGKETVLALLRKNAKVYIAARNRTKAEAAIAELKEKTGKEALFLELDLANLKSVKGAAEEFRSKESQVHILYNNGGVFVTPIDQLTSDGYDLQFGTNVLGHFYPASPAHTPRDRQVRARETRARDHGLGRRPYQTWPGDQVGDAQRSQRFAHKVWPSATLCTKQICELIKEFLMKSFSDQKSCLQGNVVVARELARRYGDQGIISISLNPGNVTTEIHRHASGLLARFMNMVMYPAPLGALTQLWAGTMSETAEYNGKYLFPWARLGEPRKDTQDPETGVKLWEWLEEQVKDV